MLAKVVVRIKLKKDVKKAFISTKNTLQQHKQQNDQSEKDEKTKI